MSAWVSSLEADLKSKQMVVGDSRNVCATIVSDPWPPAQCQAWVPSHEADLKFKQVMVGDSYNVCATIVPTYHVVGSLL